jgi:tetratricopeptide (TPR) repeat protein
MARSDAGDDDAALALYLEALALDRARPHTLYNIGLIYKYRRDWQKSLRYNLMAAELRPQHNATNWNTGIAATALKDWRTARDAWRREGMKLDEGDEPIVGNFGHECVRLNGFGDTDAASEVVWARRLSPVTARIDNVPTPEARFRFGDVVLHDGAPVGTRFDADGVEVSVFNAFELFEASPFATWDLTLEVPDAAALEELFKASEEADMSCEDWTSMRMLCKACSEGHAHEQHDHDEKNEEWQVERRVGIASKSADTVNEVLVRWCADSRRRVLSIDGED